MASLTKKTMIDQIKNRKCPSDGVQSDADAAKLETARDALSVKLKKMTRNELQAELNG